MLRAVWKLIREYWVLVRQKVFSWYNNISPLLSPFPLGFVPHEYRGEVFLHDLFVDNSFFRGYARFPDKKRLAFQYILCVKLFQWKKGNTVGTK